MNTTIGHGTTLSEREFLRRVRIAFRAIDISEERSDFLQNVLRTIDRVGTLSEAQFTALCRATVRFKAQISDRLVVDFAAEHMKAY